MYNYDYYANLDRRMWNLLKAVAWNTIMGASALVTYLLMQPIRLGEYIADRINTEAQSQSEMDIRFKRLERNGHI